MTNKRITKAMKNEDIIALLNGETPKWGIAVADLVEHLQNENALLAKKNSADRKPTKVQVENEGHMVLILDFLADGENHSVSDMIKGIPTFKDFNTSKVSALVKKLKDSGQVVRTEIKGRAYFALA